MLIWYKHSKLCAHRVALAVLRGGQAASAESCTHPAKRDHRFPPPIAERQRLPNVRISASADGVLSIGSAEKQCLQTGRVRDVEEIPQSRMATAKSRLPVRDIRDTVNPPRGFDQSAMHSADRPIKLSGSHRTQTQTSEVRWTARSSGHWVVASMFA